MMARRDAGRTFRMVRRAQNEIGDQGDAETRGDETLDGNVILGLEGDLGGKAALATHLKEVAPTAGAPGDPLLVLEFGDVHDVCERERVVWGEGKQDLVIQQMARGS